MVDRLHSFATGSFGGVTCAQFWVDFYLWEAVLNENPHLKGIVEIGTWHGGFSLYLGAQASAREMFFVTFDSVQPDREIRGFERVDVFRNPERVQVEAGGVPVALFCDGGNKPRELATFPQLLHPDSIVLVHDWGTETTTADVPATLEEVYGRFCDEIGSVTRVFKIREESPPPPGPPVLKEPVELGAFGA